MCMGGSYLRAMCLFKKVEMLEAGSFSFSMVSPFYGLFFFSLFPFEFFFCRVRLVSRLM
jgi:hypothetical protein